MGVSVILYGRNDSHGYNLHKRAAISLNCIAEVLSDDDDEILFVDYNTPDLLPTFPEAIQDTLTANAKRRLRVFRVRSPSHARFAGGTHLEVLEPVARNVALRRSNPGNRWMLSTNTDMILLPSAGRSLSALLEGLADGFYHLPRFELPEGLWESFDRADPAAIMAQTDRWAREFHLRQVVYGSPTILFDAPGDFQLALRSDLFAIDGFDEEMIRGWHVDSNLAKRMGLRRGRIDSLEAQLAGYHCDHTRQASALHGPDLPRNDSDRFVDGVSAPGLPRQAATWGLAGEAVESFTLLGAAASSLYLPALRAALPEPQAEPARAAYRSDSYNHLDYDWRVALPFLLDAVAACPPDQIIGYAGVGRGFFKGFAAGLAELLPAARILALDSEAATGLPNVETADWTKWQSLPSLFLFEIGQREGESARSSALLSGQVITLFDRLTRSRARGPATRVIAVNAVHTDFEPILERAASCPPAPFGSRIRQGYLKRPLPQVLRQDIDADAQGIDPRLRRWTERFMGGDRTPWSLERAGFLTLLEEAFDFTPGRPRRRVLLACHLAEPLGGMLASIGVDVDFVDPLVLLDDADACDWRPELAHLSTLVPSAIGSMDRTTAYDAVIWPQNSLLIRGANRAAELFRQVHRRLAPEGLLAFSLDAWDESYTTRTFAAATGYREVSAPADLPGAPPLWIWRKGQETDQALDRLAAALGPDFSKPVDVTRRMQAKAWIESESGVWRIGHDTPNGHALFGPYLALPPGQYEASVEARVDQEVAGGSLLRLEVALGPNRVVARTDYTQSDLEQGSAMISFEATDAEDPMEIRVVHFGRADLTLGQVVVTAVTRK